MENQEHTDDPSVRDRDPGGAGRDHPVPGELGKGEHSEQHQGTAGESESSEAHKELHIFVNRRKFGRSDGVKERMTGAEIAALVGVPPESAVVRVDSGSDKREIGVNEVVHIKNGEHFLVTRKVVEGGYVA